MARFSVYRWLEPPVLQLVCLLYYPAEKQLDVADLSDHPVRGCVRYYSNGYYTERYLGGYACLPSGIVVLLQMFRGRRPICRFRDKGLLAPAASLLSGRAVKDR
jgi:hypothetical protein